MQKRINPLEIKQEPEKVAKAPKAAKEVKPEVKAQPKVEATPATEKKPLGETVKGSVIFIGLLNKQIVADAKAKNPGKKLSEIINEALAEKGR